MKVAPRHFDGLDTAYVVKWNRDMDIQCPISTVDLPGVPDLELQGLIVVVGPNSSGKTLFLHDLDEVVVGRARQFVVASAVSFRAPPTFDEYFGFLLERGTIRESGTNQFVKRSLQYGADEGAGSFRKTNVPFYSLKYPRFPLTIPLN